MRNLRRREFIVQGSATLAAIAGLYASRLVHAFPARPGEEVIPWLDQPAAVPDPIAVQTQLVWEDLDSWITPNDKFFSISHFNRPTIDEKYVVPRDRGLGQEALEVSAN